MKRSAGFLTPSGSLVIDIGGAWTFQGNRRRRPTTHYELLIMLCKEVGFHLAQDFFWWNPAKLPSPAEWVTVRRVRVKDSINCVWWLSPTPWPKASNKRVPVPYSEAMKGLLKNGYQANVVRPTGMTSARSFARPRRGDSVEPDCRSQHRKQFVLSPLLQRARFDAPSCALPFADSRVLHSDVDRSS